MMLRWPWGPSSLLRGTSFGAVLCLIGLGALGQPLRLSAESNAALQIAQANPAWVGLTAEQRAALKPLERDWAAIDGNDKRKWLKLAKRYPRLSAQGRARMQSRMSRWARLTPQERSVARQRYQEAKRIKSKERRSRWEAYKALPPDRRRELAGRAASRAGATGRRGRTHPQDMFAPGATNLVPSTSLASPKSVAPSVIQAQPGATTLLMSKQPAPPAHQQSGLPKITATPGFVDKATLLPQRGAQGAAAHPPVSK